MKVEHPLRVEWYGFRFIVFDKVNTIWFQGISETGESEFMDCLSKLLQSMTDNENFKSQQLKEPATVAEGFTPFPEKPEQVVNGEKKFNRTAHMKEYWAKRKAAKRFPRSRRPPRRHPRSTSARPWRPIRSSAGRSWGWSATNPAGSMMPRSPAMRSSPRRSRS